MSNNVFYNLVRFYTATTGDSDVTVGAAVPGCLTPALAGVSDSEDVQYGLITYSTSTRQPVGGEVGLGRYISSGPVFKRSTVYASTDSDNSAIDLTGVTQIYLMPTASYFNDMLPQQITMHEPTTAPSAATLGDLKLFKSQNVTGLEEVFVRGSKMRATPLQRSLSLKPAVWYYPGGGNIQSPSFFGGNTSSGTGSATDDSTFGYMVNLISGTSANNPAGRNTTTPYFSRGNNHFRGGFLSYARVGFSEKTGLYFYNGFSSVNVLGSGGNADDPGGDYALFQYSPTRGGSGDTNFRFITKDNSTQHNTDTGMATTINKVYDFFIYCPMSSSTIYWRIKNVTDNTEVSGGETNNLPTSATNMQFSLGIVNQSGVTGKNFKMTMAWAEPDDVDTP